MHALTLTASRLHSPHDVLAELDGLLIYRKDKKVTKDMISDINLKTISYIMKCNKQKSSRNVQATKRYLEEKKLLAIPFCEGVEMFLIN